MAEARVDAHAPYLGHGRSRRWGRDHDRTRSVLEIRVGQWLGRKRRSTAHRPRSRPGARTPTKRPCASRATTTVLPASARASGVAGTRTNRVPSETARWPDPAGPAWTRPANRSGTVAGNLRPAC